MFSQPSNAWNDDLALLAAALTTAASGTSSAAIIKAYADLQFNDNKSYNYDKWPSEEYFRYSIASKKLNVRGEEREIIAIICAGTEGSLQGVKDKAALATRPFYKMDNNNFYYAYDYFHDYYQEVYNSLLSYWHLHVSDQSPIFLVSGHSLGGAAANLVAAALNATDLKAGVYAFTFGALNPVQAKQNSNGILSALISSGGVVQFDNIFNIYNWSDCYGPTGGGTGNATGDKPLKGNTIFEKFGHVVTFKTPPCSTNCHIVWELPLPHHDFYNHRMDTCYLPAARNGAGSLSGLDGVKIVSPYKTLIKIACPVDVALYDGSGNLLGEIIDNEILKADLSVALIVVDDEKYIWLPDDNLYQLKLTATDNGRMDYGVKAVDLVAGEAGALKEFTNVALTPGKQMASSVGGDISVQDVRLFVTDTGGIPIKEVLPDGTEQSTQQVSRWWQSLPAWLQWILRYIFFGWIWM